MISFPGHVDYYDEIDRMARDIIEDNIESFEKYQGSDPGDELFEIMEEHVFNFLYYSTLDAAYVLEHSRNVEDDEGLWNGQDPADALRTQAIFTTINDLRESMQEIHESISEDDDYRESLRDMEPEIEPGSIQEREQLSLWLRKSTEVGIRGGYPLGSSYIDSRCGYCFTGDRWYINFDHEVASRLPHWAGKYRHEIKEYLSNSKALTR